MCKALKSIIFDCTFPYLVDRIQKVWYTVLNKKRYGGNYEIIHQIHSFHGAGGSDDAPYFDGVCI